MSSLIQPGATGASAASTATSIVNTFESSTKLLEALSQQLAQQLEANNKAAEAAKQSMMDEARSMISSAIGMIVGGAISVASAIGSFGLTFKEFNPPANKMVDAELGGLKPPAPAPAPIVEIAPAPVAEVAPRAAAPAIVEAPAPAPAPAAPEPAPAPAPAAPEPALAAPVVEIAPEPCIGGGAEGAARAAAPRQAGERLEKEIDIAKLKDHHDKWKNLGVGTLDTMSKISSHIGQGTGETISAGSKREKAIEDQKQTIWQGAMKVFEQLISVQQAAVTQALERVQTILQANAQASGR